MSHLPEPRWRGSNGPSNLPADWRNALPEWAKHAPDPPTRRRYLAWVLVCDTCQSECHNDGLDPLYATYVPDGWRTNSDGTHTCPDCLTMAEHGHSWHEHQRIHRDGLEPAPPPEPAEPQ